MPPGTAEPVLPSASPTDFIHSGSAAIAVVEIAAAKASAAILKVERMLHLFLVSCFTESSKRPLRLAATHHLLAVRVQRVVDNPLPGVDLVIVPEPEMSETFGNSVESCRLRLVPQGIVGIRAIDDLGEERQCGITTEVVFLDDSVERALFPVVPKLYVLHVIRDGVFPLRDRHHFVDRD